MQPEYIKKNCVPSSNSFPVLSVCIPFSWFRRSEYQETGVIPDLCTKKFSSAKWSILSCKHHFYGKVKGCQYKKKTPNPTLPDFNRILIIVVKMLTCPNWIWCIDVFNAVKTHVLESFHIFFDCTEVCNKIEWKHDFKSIKFKFRVYQNICDPNSNRVPTIGFPHYL